MSRPRNYWYPIVRKMIMRYSELKKEDSIQSVMYIEAIEKALVDLDTMQDGDLHRKAIEIFYFKKTHTIAGVANKLNISERTATRWINRFVNSVGRYAGFKDKSG